MQGISRDVDICSSGDPSLSCRSRVCWNNLLELTMHSWVVRLSWYINWVWLRHVPSKTVQSLLSHHSQSPLDSCSNTSSSGKTSSCTPAESILQNRGLKQMESYKHGGQRYPNKASSHFEGASDSFRDCILWSSLLRSPFTWFKGFGYV